MARNEDLSLSLRERVLQAIADGMPLDIRGGESKSFYGRLGRGEALDVSGHAGILDYEPTELVVTARCGTPLVSIESALAERGQMLGFEPPQFTPSATLGGTVACGLSGPRRPYAGSVRDCTLGVKLLNGKGEILSFGGRVMKNVAGFDVSRFMVGALGTLGVLLEISLKVSPLPEAEETRTFEMDADEALSAMNRWARRCLPLSAICHDGTRLYVRLSGQEPAVRSCREKFGGELITGAATFWADLRDQRLAFFMDNRPLWRLSLPPASPQTELPGAVFIDWGGALRWVKTDAPAAAVFAAAKEAGGHATLFRDGDRTGEIFQPLPERLKALHIQLKKAFDPNGIFNRGRMNEEW